MYYGYKYRAQCSEVDAFQPRKYGGSGMRLVPFTVTKTLNHDPGQIQITVWVNPQMVVAVEHVVLSGKISDSKTNVITSHGQYVVDDNWQSVIDELGS